MVSERDLEDLSNAIGKQKLIGTQGENNYEQKYIQDSCNVGVLWVLRSGHPTRQMWSAPSLRSSGCTAACPASWSSSTGCMGGSLSLIITPQR